MNKHRNYTNSLFWVTVLFVFNYNFVFSQNTFSSEEELKKEANKFFEDGDFIKAYPLFSQLLSIYTKDPQYNYKFGACLLYSSNDKEKAIPYLEYAAKRQNAGADKEVFFYLGKAYHLNYRFSDAIKQYNLYKSMATAKSVEKYEVERQIEMCENGKRLLRTASDLSVLEKKEVHEKDFFRSYNLTEFNAKIILTPEELKSSADKKRKEEENIMYLAPNRKELYFASYGDKSKTGKDIYLTQRTAAGGLSKPVRMGDVINTLYDEDYAFLHPNGKTLYFCSKGHNSMGGYDVFKSEWDATSKSWGKPRNMDFPINTPDDDILFVSDEENKTAFFSSRRENAMGNMSVYKIRLDRKPIDVAIITGVLVKETGDKVPSAKITVTKANSEEVMSIVNTNSSDGSYQLRVPNGGKVSLTIESPDFTKTSQVVTIPILQEVKPLSQKIILKNDGTSDKVVIENNFDAPSDNIESFSAQYIREKANLDVTAEESETKDSSIVELENPPIGNSGNTVYDKHVVNEKQVSNTDIINIAYEDAKQTQKTANESRRNSDAAEKLSNKKNELAIQKQQESQLLLKGSESIANQSEKIASLDKATLLKKQADTLSNESALALTISKQLDAQARSLQKQADEELKYAKDLDNAIRTGADENKMNNLLAKKEKLDKQRDSITTTSQEPTELKARIEEKQQEANKYMAQYLDAKQDMDDMQNESKRLKAEAAKTKNTGTKGELTQKAIAIDREAEAKSREVQTYYDKAKVLQMQTDSIKNNITISNAMMNAIQSGSNTSSTSASSNIPAGSSNISNPSSTNPSTTSTTYAPAFIQQVQTAEKTQNELEKESKLAAVYQQWTDSLDNQISKLKKQQKEVKAKEEQKAVENKIAELSSSADDKRQKAADSRSKVDKLKLNATLSSVSTTTTTASKTTPEGTKTTTTTTSSAQTNSGSTKTTATGTTTTTPSSVKTNTTPTQQDPIESGFSEKLKETELESDIYERKSKEQQVYTTWSYSLHNEAVRLRQSGQTTQADELEKLSKEKEAKAVQSAMEASQVKNNTSSQVQNKTTSGTDDKKNNSGKQNATSNKIEPVVTKKYIDALPIEPLLPTTPPEYVKNKDAYRQYVALKNESDWSGKYAAKQLLMADDLLKISEQQYKESEKLANKATTVTNPAERKQLTERADDLEKNSLRNQAKSDSLKVLAINYKEEADSKLTESEMFLQSIDKDSYEEITASVKTQGTNPSEKDNATKTAATTSPSNTETKEAKETTKPVTQTVTPAKTSGTTTPVTSANTKPVTAEILSKYFDKTLEKIETLGTPYSQSKPIPVDPPLPDGLYFKVQIGAFRNAIPQNLFGGLKPVSAETTPKGFLRYTAGLFQSFSLAVKAKKQMQGLGYRDAFVVAFYNGKRISLGDGVLRAKTSGEKVNFEDLKEINNTAQASGNSDKLPPVQATDVQKITGLFYTIQIGVFSRPTTSVQLYNISPINSEKTIDGFIRYTTGKFTDEASALQAKKEIVEKGITDAFVVVYYNGKRISILQAKGLVSSEGEQVVTKEKQEKPVFNASTSPPISTPTTSSSSNNILFKVQVGAYKGQIPLEEANRLLKFAGSGIKNFKDERGLMVYTIGEFSDYTDANKLKTELINKGLSGIFVIGMKDGKKMNAKELQGYIK